jgi:hypothetical protein
MITARVKFTPQDQNGRSRLKQKIWNDLVHARAPTLSSSIRISSTVYSHDMKYQYFTAPDIEGFTMNGINAFWHCENSNRDFNVEYYSNQQDTLADFYHLIESFECHSPEN